jgi:hypothetical protein
MFRWVGRVILGVGGGVFLNYHLARPPIDIHTQHTPLSFPADMATAFLPKLINSIFYTSFSLGVGYPRINGKQMESLLSELQPLVPSHVTATARESVRRLDECVNMSIGSSPMEVLLMKALTAKHLRTWIDLEREFSAHSDILSSEQLKPQIIITGVCVCVCEREREREIDR